MKNTTQKALEKAYKNRKYNIGDMAYAVSYYNHKHIYWIIINSIDVFFDEDGSSIILYGNLSTPRFPEELVFDTSEEAEQFRLSKQDELNTLKWKYRRSKRKIREFFGRIISMWEEKIDSFDIVRELEKREELGEYD